MFRHQGAILMEYFRSKNTSQYTRSPYTTASTRSIQTRSLRNTKNETDVCMSTVYRI